MRLSRPSHPRRHRRPRGQSLVELALVTPILLLIFAGAADLGRAFYAYVAIENAAKEGALFGSRVPLCDDASGGTCANPNNVTARVQLELQQQGIRNPDGSALTPSVTCLDPGGTARGNLADCAEGDTYQVSLMYPYRLLTPILGSIIGNLDLTSTSRAVVLNVAFDPTPGASIQKYVSPSGSVNGNDIITKCLEPDDTDANGFYRSPCLDSSTADPTDTLTLRFRQGVVISYRIVVGNSGVQSLSGVTVVDSQGATGCSFPGTFGVGYIQTCNYTRTAPTVVGAANTQDYVNTATIDSAITSPATSGVTVIVERPPAEFQVLKFVSPFRDGGDGDGVPGFGTLDTLAVTYSTQIPTPTAWFRVVVRNIGGQTAGNITITDSRGALPYGQNNATAVCPAAPTTIAAGGFWECRYRASFSSSRQGANPNTVTATSPDVVQDTNDSMTATVNVSSCTGSNRSVPDLIGLTKAQSQSAWSAAGFTGTLTVWNGQNSATTVTQTRPAFECVAANSAMTVTRTTTP